MLYRRRLGRRRGDHRSRQSGRRRPNRLCAQARRRGHTARDRGGAESAERVGAEDRKGPRGRPAQVVQSDDGEPGGSGAHHDRRAGKAAGRVARRNRLWRLVRRVVRRRGQAHLRRDDSLALADVAHGGDQAADRSRGGDHALEFSKRDDHSQGWPGAGGRLHLRLASRAAETPLSALALAELAERAGMPAGVFNGPHRLDARASAPR